MSTTTAPGARASTPLRVRIRSRLLSIDVRDTTFEERGFEPGSPASQAALEGHAAHFVLGFNEAVGAVDVADLDRPLAAVPPEQRGFAYEGAGMALAVLDLLTPGSRDRLARLLQGHGKPHLYEIYGGAGWALARLRLRPRDRFPALQPFLRSCAIDGYGFHEGAFRTKAFVTRQSRPRRLRGYQLRAFDQGLGRALWFVNCADPDRIARMIDGFDEDRRADLWSGIGLAATYSIAAQPGVLERLVELSGRFQPEVAQGSAFAATMRHTGGIVVEHTRTAAQELCGRSVEEAAELVNGARAGLEPDPIGESYGQWRVRVQQALGSQARSESLA